MTEHDLMRLIQIKLSQLDFTTFRINVGTAWTGSTVIHNHDGSITILNPRRFNSGAPPGFSDLIAIKDGKINFVETKGKNGRVSDVQKNFLEQMQRKGCRAGVARSVEDALKICEP